MSEATDALAMEVWLRQQGLPWFVDGVRHQVERRVTRARLATVVVGALLVGAVVGAGVAWVSGDATLGPAAAVSAALIALLGYALTALHAWVIVVWALRRGFASLRLLFRLATRALPMLLLFVTFLFINTEVWQVASALRGGVLWGSVLFFALAAVGFLVPRLAEELDEFDDAVDATTLERAADGMAWEAATPAVLAHDVDLPERAQVKGLEMVNLVAVLVVAQAVQVLVLALSVFAFFLLFGAVAIEDSVITAWLGHPPHYPLPGPHLVSTELVHVAMFLAAFSGLYFTVVAITDELYRRQFFHVVEEELARAVAARLVYRALHDVG